MDFNGKRIVITGASSGIGRETALAFAGRGARLALVARNRKRLEETRKACIKRGAIEALAIECDVSNHRQVKMACSKIGSRFGGVDVLVNNAGYGVYGAFRDANIKDIEGMMAVNYLGTVYFTKELLPRMERGSHIVNVDSMAGKLPLTNFAGYCASKFAVWGFSESIYHELNGRGIGVHVICPSATRTRFFDNKSFAGHPHRKHPERMEDPAMVAEWIIDAIEVDRMETISPIPKERLAVFLLNNFPRLFHMIMHSRYVRRQLEKGKL